MYTSQEMLNLRRFLARFLLRDNQMTIIFGFYLVSLSVRLLTKASCCFTFFLICFQHSFCWVISLFIFIRMNPDFVWWYNSCWYGGYCGNTSCYKFTIPVQSQPWIDTSYPAKRKQFRWADTTGYYSDDGPYQFLQKKKSWTTVAHTKHSAFTMEKMCLRNWDAHRLPPRTSS